MTTVIATPGASTANSYVTATEANDYWSDKLAPDNVWLSASTADRAKAVIWATRMLDSIVHWAGAPVSLTQALRWPRYGLYNRNGVYIDSDEIPEELKWATSEFARYIVDEIKAVKGDAQSDQLEKLAFAAKRSGLDSFQFNEISATVSSRGPSNVVIPRDVYILLPRHWIRVSPHQREVMRA